MDHVDGIRFMVIHMNITKESLTPPTLRPWELLGTEDEGLSLGGKDRMGDCGMSSTRPGFSLFQVQKRGRHIAKDPTRTVCSTFIMKPIQER